MENLKEKLVSDLKVAMKNNDPLKKTTIRSLRSAIRNSEIDQGHELTNEETLQVISKQAKQRRDSIEQYQKANRLDLVEQEQQELAIIEIYLPQQLSDEEIAHKAEVVINEMGINDMKAMGAVMKQLTADLKGVADGKRISTVVRSLLSHRS